MKKIMAIESLRYSSERPTILEVQIEKVEDDGCSRNPCDFGHGMRYVLRGDVKKHFACHDCVDHFVPEW